MKALQIGFVIVCCAACVWATDVLRTPADYLEQYGKPFVSTAPEDCECPFVHNYPTDIVRPPEPCYTTNLYLSSPEDIQPAPCASRTYAIHCPDNRETVSVHTQVYRCAHGHIFTEPDSGWSSGENTIFIYDGSGTTLDDCIQWDGITEELVAVPCEHKP